MKTAPPSSKSAIRDIVMRLASGALAALFAQQCLYFRPLPQGQGSFRPIDDTAPPSISPEQQQRERINAGPKHACAPVEVRSRDPTRGTREAYDCAALDDFAHFHSDLREM